MNADNLRKNAGQWVRVGVLTLTTFGPIINVVSSRLRERASELQQDATKRGQATVHDLAERGNKTTQAVIERGSDIVRDIAERSSKATQEIAKQSQQTTREVSRKTQRAAQQAQRELARRSAEIGEQLRTQATSPDYAARFWSVFGFSLGLTSAIVAVYLLLKRRSQQSGQANNSIQLSNHAMLNGFSGTQSQGATANAPTRQSTAVSTPTVQASSTHPTSTTDTATTVTSASSTPSIVTPAQDITTVATPDVQTPPSGTTEESIEAEVLPAQDVQIVQEAATSPNTLPENVPTLNATAEPLIASPESEGVVSTPDELPVEVPVQDMQESGVATLGIQQEGQLATAIDTLPTAPLGTASEEQKTYQTVETSGSPERTYELGSDAAAVSTGVPVVSIDETVIPVEGLGTATVSGVVGDDDSPTVKQEAVSNALSAPEEQAVDINTMVEQVLAAQERQAAASPVAGSALLGVVSTKRYYPIETPLSVLKPEDGSELDIIYFANEDEARAQGYSAAEES